VNAFVEPIVTKFTNQLAYIKTKRIPSETSKHLRINVEKLYNAK